MTLSNLIKIEYNKYGLRKFWIQSLFANVCIVILTVATKMMLASVVGGPQIPVVDIADTLIKCVYIVWQSALIARVIVEEFQSKTVLVLFSYPISRQKIINAKVMLVFGLTFVAMGLSHLSTHLILIGLDQFILPLDYVFSLLGGITVLLTSIAGIFMGMIPLYVGMINKSSIATVVSSIAIVGLTVGSSASNGDKVTNLLSSIPIALLFALVGVIALTVTLNKINKDESIY